MNEDSGFDKVLRGEPVAVTDARLKEMQEQARHGALLNFYDPGHRHWHWLAALNELASLRAANQPSAATENPEAMYSPVAREGHAGASARQIDVAAGAPPSACNHFPGQSTCEWCGAVQPERCCLDYPRCDCNSPPEPDNEWHCSQYPGCGCFAGCREKALEGRREPLDTFEECIAEALGYKVRP